MSDGSKIEWLHVAGKKAATLNPTTGCTKVSPGCKNCYAKREWVRLSANPKSVYYGRVFEDVRMHPERLEIPKLMTKPRRFFVDSMSDMFHDAITDEFLDNFFETVWICGHHTFIVLTKRSARMRDYVNVREAIGFRIGDLKNLQLGVSVESRDYLSRLDDLRDTPAAPRRHRAQRAGELMARFRVELERVVESGLPKNPFAARHIGFDRTSRVLVRTWEFDAKSAAAVRWLLKRAQEQDLPNVRGFRLRSIKEISA